MSMSAALRPLPPTPRLSAAEFLSWPEDPAGLRWQLVDGEPICMAPPSGTHGRVQGESGALIHNALRAKSSPCQVVMGAGIQPRVEAKWNVRIPDFLVDCDPPDPKQHLIPNPVLIVEILSPGNERLTRSNVWAYRTIPSVQDILLLYGWRVEAELLRRDADGGWPDSPAKLGAADRLILPALGLDIGLADAYAGSGLESPPG
jgi:Uma2 family endonuclease